ncbi:hypothetical protein WDH52_17530 [Streptomyces sp. TRM70308]|uniref:hypothetical protein n=1 Tax=Streptomyces sp. TRM70308 TaxID=3131932 RepID=UPI003D0626C5
MTTQRDDAHEGSAAPDAAAELHRVLGSLIQHLQEPAAEQLLHAIRTELDARDARAYASGWQDAMEATSAGRAL